MRAFCFDLFSDSLAIIQQQGVAMDNDGDNNDLEEGI
jgi:hypothetical protein